MNVSFEPITPETAHALATWRYPAPYATYNIGDEPAAFTEMLDARSPWFVAHDRDAGDTGDTTNTNDPPMGYCCFGTAAEVGWEGEPRLWTTEDRTLSVGLGLRPDLTGQGLGLPFFETVLDFAIQRFAPEAFRLFVLPFNQRAIRVYERAGFRQIGERVVRVGSPDELLFLEMRRNASKRSAGQTTP